MAYIGKQPVVGNFQVCDAISVVNGQAAYTMQVSSTNVSPESANHMLVSLNGVLQKPGSSFTISGATITFASNLATGDVIDFIILLGNVLDIGTPSDGTITEAKLDTNSGGIIDWQAVVTSNTTMVSGRGYFVNTTSGAITMTLPASANRGDEVHVIDYAATADTNNITIGRNSHKIQGASSDLTVATERAAFTLVYVDSTQGWLLKEK
jgi:hypothetical protein|tara:strand:- start:43 stop:669 length:627 start_codon:yes stop_codon:yes gene_type:complete